MSKQHTLANVEVNNSINLTLNQNDLIDLAITEQVERLETQIELVEKELKTINSDIENIKENFLSELLLTIKNDTYAEAVKVNEILGLDLNKLLKVRWNQQQTSDMIIGEYKSIPDISNNTADKITSFKRNSHETTFYKFNIKGGSIEVNSTSKNGIGMYFSFKFELSKSESSKLNKQFEPLNKKWYQLLLQNYDLNLELINYKYGEKKIKAKVVKAALSKSKEGKEILLMLERATNVKLLM